MQKLDRINDVGVYKCIAYFGNINYTSTLDIEKILSKNLISINVLSNNFISFYFIGPDDSFINITVHSELYSLASVENKHEEIWLLKYSAYPPLTSLHWHDHFNEIIEWASKINKSEKFEAVHDPSKKAITLKIRNLTIWDSGNYTLTLSNNKIKKTITLFLFVESITITTFDNSLKQSQIMPTHTLLIIAVFCFTVSLLVYTCYLYVTRREKNQDFKKLLKGECEKFDPNLPLRDQINCLPYDKQKYEIKRKNLKYIKDLGKGAFGVVTMEIVKDIPNKHDETVVAVKRCEMGSSEVCKQFKNQCKSLFIRKKISVGREDER